MRVFCVFIKCNKRDNMKNMYIEVVNKSGNANDMQVEIVNKRGNT